jgi:aminopeptidase N
MAEASAWEFAENEAKLAAAEQLLGPYLWDRYDILVLPPSFPFGGMENPRLTFLSPLVVLGDRSRTNVVSHELAHAWTGNLVTNATWEDFWLNEGWTTYAEGRITEVLNGREFNDLVKVVGLNELFEDMHRFGENAKETCLKFSQDGMDPEEVYSQVPYIKGSMFLVALEEAVGRKAFDSFIQKYISTYRFQSLGTEEFVTFLTSELPEAVRRVDINQWIYQPGYPQNAPRLDSVLYDDVKAKLDGYRRGTLPSRESISSWVP